MWYTDLSSVVIVVVVVAGLCKLDFPTIVSAIDDYATRDRQAAATDDVMNK